MSECFSIALAQLNPILGDIEHNTAKALDAWECARDAGCELIAFSEAYISGYQLQDLVRHGAFLADVARALEALAHATRTGPAVLMGAPFREGGGIYNGYFLLNAGRVEAVSQKRHLPNESVFDEKRFFSSGRFTKPYKVGGVKLGSPICEDIWQEDVIKEVIENGAEVLLVPNGSPYARAKHETQRLPIMRARAQSAQVPLIYLNLVGGQDDQVFDGRSFVLDAKGEAVFSLAAFEEAMGKVVFEKSETQGWFVKDATPISLGMKGRGKPVNPDISGEISSEMPRLPASPKGGEKPPFDAHCESDYHAMVLGLRDYVRKSGFHKVLLGLSGGIDSALVATIAADALGAENVRAVRLASPYTGQSSLDDAEILARRLGVRLDDIPITTPFLALEGALAPHFEGYEQDVSEENIQSRLRGLILMALSNKFGEMLLSTGNKSELAVGYATIYGDMAGGFNPIKDVYKLRVFELSRWRNRVWRGWMMAPEGALIPERILEKPPSAELRFDQRDDDSLPAYDILDPVLEGLIEREMSVDALVGQGFERAMVEKVHHLVLSAEYKRFQSAPGVRLSERAFWLDRRYPIVNRWRDRGY